ncbi:MAG: cell division protein ZapA [Paraprevotella sp.]|nr:cell division protein ZapA [Paraprevotella sp.]
MDDKQNITIRFGSCDISMTVSRKDEHLYRNAEELMKKRYAFYTDTYKGQDKERYLILSMLDIAVQLQYAQETSNDNDRMLFDKLTPLVEDIENKLDHQKLT